MSCMLSDEQQEQHEHPLRGSKGCLTKCGIDVMDVLMFLGIPLMHDACSPLYLTSLPG